MATPLIVSISGIRGIIGETLGPREAVEFGLAFGSFLKQKYPDKKPKVCLGRDSRPSGPMLAAGISAGILAAGCDVVAVDIVTTPGVALMTRFLGCDGGVVITASHNPIAWNGIKFLRHDGIAFPADEVKEIQRRYFDKDFNQVDSVNTGTLNVDNRAHDVHIEAALKLCDADLIASKKFKVVLDSVNGAGCVGTARLLKQLGCETIHLNGEPTGHFAHTPEPTADNLAQLGPVIQQEGAVVGFAQDPDADRLALIDEKGRYIGEEYTLALAAKYRFSQEKGVAAANLSTSRMIDDLAEQAGCTVLRTPVGEAHVANAMVANDCIIGGEGNGGVIDLRVGPVRDSFVGIVLILQMLAETSKTLSELVAEIPSYHLIKTKFPCPQDQTAAVLEKVSSHYAENAGADARVDTSDGIRVDLPGAWVQLRASNTEPIMRIMAESSDAKQSQKLIDEVQALIG